MTELDIPVPERISVGVDRTTQQIAASGTARTGAQRVLLAESARRAMAGENEPAEADDAFAVATQTARQIAAQAHTITAASADVLETPEAFVEIISVVARTAAIDTTMLGIGLELADFPEPDQTPPTGPVNPRAKRRSAFVPTVGSAGPTTALSLLPDEDAAQEALHGALYLSYQEMGDIAIHKGLPRWQLELLAARTSLINTCHF